MESDRRIKVSLFVDETYIERAKNISAITGESIPFILNTAFEQGLESIESTYQFPSDFLLTPHGIADHDWTQNELKLSPETLAIQEN